MKTPLLISFVAIAMASTPIALASVIPSSTVHHHDMAVPLRRATVSSAEGRINSLAGSGPIDDVLVLAPVTREASEGGAQSHGMGSPRIACVPQTKGLADCGSSNQDVPTPKSRKPSDYHFGGLPNHRNSNFRRTSKPNPDIVVERGTAAVSLPHSRETNEDLAASVSKSRQDDSEDSTADIQELNLALLIQQVSHAFFDQSLSRFQQDDFALAGYPDWVRGRYVQIRDQKKVHLDFLESAITTSGGESVKEGEYQFHVNDIHSFINLSEAITSVGSASYIGALHNFKNREYITVGAALLALEARQTGWINSAVRQQNPWNTPFETPLTSSQVITLLSSLSDLDFDLASSSNPTLLPSSIAPSPPLTLASQLTPGSEAELIFPAPSPPLARDERLYATFLFGFETIFAPVNERYMNPDQGAAVEQQRRYFVQIPRDLDGKGTVFVSVLRGRGGMDGAGAADGENVVAGPAIAVFPFGADK